MVIKRSRTDSKQEIMQCLDQLCQLLLSQKEDDAIEALQQARTKLESDDGAENLQGFKDIIEIFDGDDHDLKVYMHHRETAEWTEIEELANASSKVYSLAKRLSSR